MATGLIPFTYGDRPVRVVTVDGEPWFVAADVCAVLGYANGRAAVEQHVPARHRDSVAIHDGTPGNPNRAIVSEPGLYRLVMRSNALNAEPFQEWVTEEVLPSIRKTGGYGQRFEIPGTFAEALELAARQAREIETAQQHIAELEPRAAQADHHRAADGLKAVGDFANDLKAWAKTHHPGVKVRHEDVWDQLGRLDMVIRGRTVRHNQPTAKAIENGWCVPKVSDFDTPTGVRSTTTTRLTPKGEGYAWDRITAYIEANGTAELPRRIGGVA